MGLTFTGIRETAGMLRDMADRAGDLRPVWPAVGDVIADAMSQQFATGGEAGGRPWAPLSADYAAWKAKHGYSPKTLVRTGRLARSLSGRPMGVETYDKDSAEFGSDVPYFRYHQYGTKKMPRREILFRFEPMVTRANRKIAAWIIDGTVT